MKKYLIGFVILFFLVCTVDANWDTIRAFTAEIFGSGMTTNAIPKATGANSLGDSVISDDGTNVIITKAAGGQLVLKSDAAAYTTFTQPNADGLTMTVVSDGTADVTVSNPLIVSGAITASGNIAGLTQITLDTDAAIVLTATDVDNEIRINNDADVIDYTLPTAVAGYVVMFYDISGGVITVDANTGDVIYLDGTALDAGDAIDSPGAAGDFICLVALDATRWITMGRSGVWVDGGVD